MSQKKLLFVSTHTDQITGYSKVAYNILKRLQDKTDLDIYHFGFQRNATYRRTKLNITQYDAQANEDPKEHGFGFNCFPQYLKLVNPDIIFIYNDTLVVNQFLSLIPETNTAKIIVYLDQVYKGTSLGEIHKRADKLAVFSPHWEFKFPEDIKLPQFSLQHAPDDHVRKLSKAEIESFKEKNNLQGKTIFLNINRNSNRKRLDLTIQAFKHYLKTDKDAILILVTSSEGFYDINLVASIEQIPKENLMFLDTKENKVTDEHINLIYNIADYGINTADGEGVGLSTLEHAYLGKPQLTLDIGSYRDFLTDEDSVLIKPTIRTHIHNSGIGLFTETTTAEEVSIGLTQLKDKHSPKVTLNWDSIVETLYDNLKSV